MKLIKLSRARQALSEAKSLDEIKEIKDVAKAAKAYAIAKGMGIEMKNEAAEIEIRAERKIGELLKVMPKARGGDRGNQYTGGKVAADDLATLSNLGITKDQSSVSQKLAVIEEDDFEEVIYDIKSDGESLSKSKVLSRGLFSSDSNEWYTPSHIVELVQQLFGEITLDPCSNSGDPNIPSLNHYTKEVNGLERDWFGKVYMNPPYGSEIKFWVEKLLSEHNKGNVYEAIALVPARTDTIWFHSLREYPRCFIKGRLSFSGGNCAPFPSCAIYLGPQINKFSNIFNKIGDCYGLL